MNVLIVDDDKLARKGLIAVIDWEQYGLCVVGDVQNGKKALAAVEEAAGGACAGGGPFCAVSDVFGWACCAR